ncbi:TIGR04219 family outer membrane beta-barrel protein [Oceanobacter sp. 5_MG-2023]|uniref:TIGR04219 family outer membrane beta-barrel protein n=1 Tax=Oceanobacter sp. 5_MG-2023 TaxID=3062645 RepID=UPI0026E41CBD|nr:TIGR04219 family outer membrane beta-barrel protein [Oceanobacter sp. 5_MG-2023]MDO6682772.1 TIGR04219 family outer membrane beta-barrel protein [Oceanobacter sp. 5_MG-2023]
MKKTVMAVALVALAPLSAQADLLFTVGAKASVWNADPTGQIDSDVSVEEDGLNMEEENGQQLTVFFEHPVPFIPNVKIKSTSLEVSGNGTVDITFADETFDGDVNSTIDLTHTDLTLYWGLPLPIPFVDINFGVSGRQFDGYAEVKSASNTETVDLDLVLPMVYGELKIDTPFGLYASADINYVGYGDNKLSDISYGVGYLLPIPVVDLGLEAGYRQMTLETDPDDIDIETDLDVSGVYYGLSLSIGL